MTLHYTPMGGGGSRRGGPSPQRVYHGQNDAFRADRGPKTARDLEVERLKQSLHGENAHVPDCLTWNVEDTTDRKNGDGSYASPRSPRKDYYSRRTADGREFSITSYKALPRHPELGRPKNHLYGDDGPPDVNWKVRPNEGGVADAMVGWPGTRREQEEEDRYGRWEVDLGHGKGTARGNQMDSCDCNGKCQKKYKPTGMDDHDHHPHNAKSVPDRGCCDHRTCGCVPERHPRHQVTYEDHSHLPQQSQQQQQQQQQQQRCPHCRNGDPSKSAFHVM